jgi:transitional endoplasmic reticulum ATPase
MPVEQSVTLRVSEAPVRDAGRTVVRLDPSDMQALGASVGDIVELRGAGGTAAAKVLPALLEDRGKHQIQMDGILRANCGAGLEDEVHIRLLPTVQARSLVVSPVGSGSNWQQLSSNRHSLYFKRLFEGLVVMTGNTIRINLFGSSYQDFVIEEATPPAPAWLVGPGTALRLREPDANRAPDPKARQRRNVAAITYEDIGGLSRQLSRIREMIELPLKHPEVFERLGIEPPKGVLLYGPPGTGKTMIARAVANEANAYFITINGPEVMHSLYGQSEAHLRNIFKDAQTRAPSIIFLDEIDAIAPKRSDSFHEVDRRVVAQLLALLDGLQSRGRVVVIGATNLPDSLDPALRRPGRFDRELAIQPPDRKGRREILDIYTRGMPLANDVDIEDVADTTHGFVGADIAALCREAALAALRRTFPDFEFVQGAFSFDQLLSLQVGMPDFRTALTEVAPSALREFNTTIPDTTWEDVGGLENIKQTMRETIEYPMKYADLMRRVGARPTKGILLYGAPGSGKTLIAKAVANEANVNFITVKGPEFYSKWVGESEKAVREIFKRARASAPCIIFLDELDAIAPARVGNSADAVAEKVVAQLLTEIDGVAASTGVIMLAATNRPDMVDPAMLRPGRFDTKIEIPLPEAAMRLQILKVHMRNKPLKDENLLEQLMDETEGWSGADIEVFTNRAALNALQRALNATPNGEISDAALAITRQDLDAALDFVEEQRYLQRMAEQRQQSMTNANRPTPHDEEQEVYE